MAALPLQSVIVVQAWGELCDQTILNSWYYRCLTSNPPDPLIDYRQYLDGIKDELVAAGGLEEQYLDALPANYTLMKWRIQPIWPTRLRYKDYERITAGTNQGTSVTANLAISVSRFSVQGGRRGIGRLQVPAITEHLLNGKYIAGGYGAVLQDLADEMKLDINVGGFTPLDLTPVLFNFRAPNPTAYHVDETFVQNTVRTMHRRTVGLGI